MEAKKTAKRKPPVHIPLAFDDAVRGLLNVDPKQLPKKTAAVKKSAPKKAVKRKKA
jgi:hypothetical protein